MDKELQSVLIKIAKALNAPDILWSVGASLLLEQYSLVDNPTDIDITASINDIRFIDNKLSALGEKQKENESELYSTDYFYEYIIDGINVDVMAGLKINLREGIYEYKFDKESVPHSFKIDNTQIPFSTLEEWYILYQLMPAKKGKVTVIESYFKINGIQYPGLLHRMADSPSLPEQIKSKISALIANSI